MNFSFFYTRGGAGTCRGKQIANYLGAKHNPKSGYDDDICIYVKMHKHPYHPKHSYIDVVDAPLAVDYLKIHPELGVIADSIISYQYLSKILKRDDVVFIPHHHCNYNRVLRPKREVKIVGIIGNKNSFQYPIEEIREKLYGIGLDLLYEDNYWEHFGENREKIVDFYKQIDIQIVWRPEAWSPRYVPLRRPLKLANAGSFGIPTVAYPENDYVSEWKGCFIGEETIDGLLNMVEALKDDSDFYKEFSERALKKAEDYHIEHISKLYLNLK